jgi:urease accessory protein UreF
MEHGISQLSSAPGPEALLGNWPALLEQVGTPEALTMLNASKEAFLCPKIDDLESLGVFLEAYQEQRLYPVEWPTIIRAHTCACHNQTRELIALDRTLASQGFEPGFARASRRIGQVQLQQLRPLRDQRVVQRYLEAVDTQQADGWHTLVYGVTLAVYSLPIRQGLINYARQTLQGFIEAAGRPLQIVAKDRQELLEQRCFDMAARLEKLVNGR